MKQFKFTVLFALFFVVGLVVNAQTVINFQTSPGLSDQEVQKLIVKYRTADIAELKMQFAQVKADQPVKDAVAGLPDQWKEISLSKAQVGETRLWLVGSKALKITTASDYEFIYLRNSAPLAVSDSNCLLLITSGMLQLTDGNDDALLGVMIHEMAHGLFVSRSTDAKMKFNQAVKAKDWVKADEMRRALALIEIECDLIAGRMLLEAKYKVSRYADLQVKLQEIENELKIARSVQWHPEGALRKRALLNLSAEGSNLAKN